jgi:hypothetical protein
MSIVFGDGNDVSDGVIGRGIAGMNGVKGWCPSGSGIGVYGKTDGDFVGVYGRALGAAATCRGVVGEAPATGIAVEAIGKMKCSMGFAAWGGTPPASKPTITGSRSTQTASVLQQTLAALAAAGLLTDSTTA